jgi:uncharacterized phage-associated protein
VIFYNFNKQKAIEAILWLLQTKKINQIYHVIKAIFYADKYHLNKYYRPIIGDTYVAMKYGPVADKTYSLLQIAGLKKDILVRDGFEKSLPFSRSGRIIEAKRKSNTDILSESDIEALEFGLKQVAGKSFQAIKNDTHKMPGYKKTWEKRTTGADQIDYIEFLDSENLDKSNEIFECSEELVL